MPDYVIPTRHLLALLGFPFASPDEGCCCGAAAQTVALFVLSLSFIPPLSFLSFRVWGLWGEAMRSSFLYGQKDADPTAHSVDHFNGQV